MLIKNGYLSTYGLPEADEKKKSPIQAIFRVIFLLVLPAGIEPTINP